MRTSKLTIAIFSVLLIVLTVCVALATWIIETTWQQYDPAFGQPVYISRIIDADYQSDGINLKNKDGAAYKQNDGYKFKFYAKNGSPVEDVTVQDITFGTIIVNGQESESLKVGGTYNISGVSIKIDSKYRIVGTVANPAVPESFITLKDSNYIYLSNTDGTTANYNFTNLIFKYKTVQIDNGGNYYTIEDALNNAISGQTVIVKANTSFASKTSNINIGPVIQGATPKTTSVADLAEYSGNTNHYTVKSGVTLLLPMGQNNTDFPYDTKEMNDSYATLFSEYKTTGLFSTLTVPSGIDITVNGNLYINGARVNGGPSQTSYTNKAYGYSQLEVNGSVNLEYGARFVCYGFSYGAGTVTANSGATVMEPLVLNGWKGGSISACIYKNVFPINQFNLTNIEGKVVFEYGANYLVRASLEAGDSYFDQTIKFLGSGTDDDSFVRLKQNSKIIKFVDIRDTDENNNVNDTKGKVYLQSEGSVSFHNIGLTVSMLGIDVDMTTAGLQVPIPANFVLEIKSGIATIPNGISVKLLPGAKCIVDAGATLQVESGGSIYSYGQGGFTGQTGKYEGAIPSYKDSGGKVTAWKDGNNNISYPNLSDSYRGTQPNMVAKDAKIDIKGVLMVNSGATVGATIGGSDGGMMTLSGKLSDHILEDYSESISSTQVFAQALAGRITGGNNTLSTYFDSTIISYGENEDGIVPLTNTTYVYQDGKWTTATKTISYKVNYDANGGTLTGNASDTLSVYVPETWTETTISHVDTTNPVRDYYTFTGWYKDKACKDKLSADNPFTITEGASNVLTVYAGWSKIQYTVNYVISGADGANHTNPVQWNVEDGTIMLSNATHGNEALEFKGWFSDSGYTNPITAISEENAKNLITDDGVITIYGYFEDANKEYDYEFNLDTGTTNYTDLITPAGGKIKLGETLGEKFPNDDDFTKHDYEVNDQYYFGGWLANGKPVNATTTINGAYLTDGKLIIKANWITKHQLIIQRDTNLTKNLDKLTITVDYTQPGHDKTNLCGKAQVDTISIFVVDNTEVTITVQTTAANNSSGGYTEPSITVNEIKENAKSKTIKVISNITIIYSGTHSDETCLVEGTLIMMADGTQKPIEEVMAGDDILVFNHETGKYEAGKMWFVDDATQPREWHTIVRLKFSDGSAIGISYRHGFFDLDLNKYVYIDEFNYNEFIGHRFTSVKQVNGEYVSGEVKLVSGNVAQEYVRVFGPISEYHFNMVTDGLLTMPSFNYGETGFFNFFEFGEGMKYDEAKMQADIEKYGLFTYEEFADLITYDIWCKAPMQYLKISIAKGLMTFEDIELTVQWLINKGFFG